MSTVQCLLLLLTAAAVVLSDAEYVAKYPYLYATEANNNASWPVIEHVAPLDDDDDDDRPDFIYNPKEGHYRIVEYYIHYCNTCKGFRPVYIDFAKKIRALVAQTTATATATVSSNSTTTLDVYAVSCSPNRHLCMNQNVSGFPKIRLYKAGDAEYIELKHHLQINPYKILQQLDIQHVDESDDDWDAAETQALYTSQQQQKHSSSSTVQSASQSSLSSLWTSLQLQFGFTSSSTQTSIVPQRRRRSRDDLKSDIHMSLDYILRNEIYTQRHSALTTPQALALEEFIALCVRTIPQTWTVTVELLQELQNNIIYIVKSEDYLVAVLDEYTTSTTEWSVSCSHNEPDQGYTCGLWELLHTITVGVVEYNGMVATAVNKEPIATATAALTIRNFIGTYFGCDECRTHFVQSYERCDHDRCDRLSFTPSLLKQEWIELPLWLLEVHNHVNLRLLQQRHTAGRQQEELISIARWPSTMECTVCWNTNDDDDDIIASYDPDAMYQYLKLEYGQRDGSSAAIRKQLTIVQPDPDDDDDTDTDPKIPFLHQKIVVGILSILVGIVYNSKKTSSTIGKTTTNSLHSVTTSDQ